MGNNEESGDRAQDLYGHSLPGEIEKDKNVTEERNNFV